MAGVLRDALNGDTVTMVVLSDDSKILIDEAISLHDASNNALERGKEFKPPRRISCQRIAELIRIMSGGEKTPNQSTVNKAIKNSTDKELKIVWEGLQVAISLPNTCGKVGNNSSTIKRWSSSHQGGF